MKIFVVYADQYEGYSIEYISLIEENARKFRKFLRKKYPQDYFGIFVGELDKQFNDDLENDLIYKNRTSDVVEE